MPGTISVVRRGRSANCSATGVVVGAALVSVAAAAVVVNAFADRFTRWVTRDRTGGDGGPVDHGPGVGRSGAPDDGPEPGPRLRPETFGAWLSVPGAAALLALDPAAAAAALDAGARPIGGGPSPEGALSAPLEVHLAVTDRCPVACDTCYLPPAAAEPAPIRDDELDALAALGVFEVAIGGGESTPRAEVVALARRIRARGMVANLTTSGFQLDDAAAATAAALFGQVNVSLDGVDDAAYRGVRGWSGAGLGLRAIDRLVAAGARVGVNTVITRSNVDALPALGRALADRGITDWQWLRLKPVGRAAADYAERTPTADQLRALWPTALAIEADTGLPIRWDCAMVPFLAAHGLPVEALRALAVTGCPAGQSLLARTAGGGWTPCSFAHDAAEAGPVDAVWAAGGALTRWRGRVATLSAASGGPTLAEPCASCPYAEVCRGGCRVVAAFHGDPGAPDPECPRVVAFRVQGPAVERPAVGPGVTG